jgi:tetratricopeptide (TPR) repeat protein
LIGRPPPFHRETLDTETLIPLSTLLSPLASAELFRNRARTAMFYAQSWAFVHYVLLGENGRHQRGLQAFLRLQNSGLPLDEQFEQAFGMSLREMENALKDYVHRRRVPALQLNPPETSLADAPQPISEVEALHLQGDLLVTLGVTSEAEEFLQKAARLDAAHIDTRLSLVRCRMQQNRLDEALPLVESAVAAAPDSFAAHQLHGAVLRSVERYTDAVAAYGRALKLKPDDAGSFYGASIAQVAIGQPQARETFAAVLTLDPDPGWYWSRVFDTWELGRTEYVIDDGRAYLAQQGWITESSVYVALAVALEHFRRGEAADAEALLVLAAEQSGAKSWPAKLTAFLRGRIAESKLLEDADSPGLLTEARTYIGIKALIDGRFDEGLQHLNWVKASGSREYLEYRMALGELKRLATKSTSRSAN